MWCDKTAYEYAQGPLQTHSNGNWSIYDQRGYKPLKVKETPIDLSTFKTLKCSSTDQKHNKKHCMHYHNDNDRRRNTKQFTYKCDFCINGRNCPIGDDCEFSHNKVEQLYHPNRYKTKYCQSNLENCEYGIFYDEINIPLKLHLMTYDENFWLNCYKTVWCPYIENHDRAQCVYAHNAQDFRRDLQTQPYNPVDCPSWNKSQQVTTYEQGGCPQMDNCPNCHGWKELEYHPYNFRTKRCSYGINCVKKGKDCAYYHTEQDRRAKPIKQEKVQSKPPPPQLFSNDLTWKKQPHYKASLSNFNGPIIPDQALGSKIVKKKLQIGQPFEVFSSTSLTNHTSSGSRKMSDTSNEGKPFKQPPRETLKKKECSQPKKNRTAPSTPEQAKIYSMPSNEAIDVSSNYQQQFFYSPELTSLLTKYEAPEILSILEQRDINESRLMKLSDAQLNQMFLNPRHANIIKAVMQEMNEDMYQFIHNINNDCNIELKF